MSSYFGQDTLQPSPQGDILKDYTHASKTFRSAGYDLAPRNKFLFYVYFNVNLNIPALANLFSGGKLSTVLIGPPLAAGQVSAFCK